MSINDYIHRYVPATSDNTPTLLLLHGTGGNEYDLIPLGRELSPGSALLSPRGKVLEAGMPRFFRRFAEGVFDVEDLKFRTAELADFVTLASKEYNFPKTILGVGYSNGANIAVSMLLLRPHILSGAILFRAMVSLVPEKLPDLSDKYILLSEGRYDPIASGEQAKELEKLLRKCGANVTMNWAESDHSLSQGEIPMAKRYILETTR
jgi:phospholipase/carboxylesterase